MKTKVFLSAFLRYNEGKHEGFVEMQVEGDKVRDVIEQMKAQNVPNSDRLLDDKGKLRNFIVIFVNEQDVRTMDNLDTPIKNGDEVDIIVAISGG